MIVLARAQWKPSGTKFNSIEAVVAGVTDLANAIFETSQELVAVDTGDLKASGAVAVEVSGNQVSAEVSYGTDHAMFSEFGTGVRGEGTYPYDLPQEGVPITGSWIYDYKKQNWQGHPSHAYLRPAFDAHRDNATDVVAQPIKDALG
jgi:hypothetical protein